MGYLPKVTHLQKTEPFLVSSRLLRPCCDPEVVSLGPVLDPHFYVSIEAFISSKSESVL